jgi:DNA (cytosine-5)-methyltransferase 1
MRFLSVCSGIEAASVAWNPLGWKAAAFSEIEPFPCSLLAHHYPDVPNLGDMTKFQEWPDLAIDLLCGGTPCQSFSVAGLRKGLADPRGNLMLTFGAIAARYRPKWLVWENVPGVLSSNGGRDFGAFLGMLGQLGYGFAYRVLDAQYFGVPQRRRRVFVVGCAGDWRSAAAVLFERHSLSGHSAPRRETREDTAGSTGDGIARCITTGEAKRQDWETCNIVAWSMNLMSPGRQVRRDHGVGALTQDAHRPTQGNEAVVIQKSMQVRRLTPRECERLQGFSDEYTLVPHRSKPAADGPRYKALGNSWAVPCARWIGQRIEALSPLTPKRQQMTDTGRVDWSVMKENKDV